MSRLLDFRPENVRRQLGAQSKVCLLNSRTILRSLKDEKLIVMACNIRIPHVVPGIMRAAQELNSIVAFELAKSEGGRDGGYTGLTPNLFFETIVDYAERERFSAPFFIHGDHITIRNTSEEEIHEAEALIQEELEAGYTSFAIDASFNELEDNIRITSRLARKVVDAGLGLEVEVGEIKYTGVEGEITTVEEARDFITALIAQGIQPNLLAIFNGGKHGNYKKGEKIHIDLKRTGEIYDVVRPHGVRIAQHGITGTPIELIGQFADYGIRKGNVGTTWQNVAHAGLPESLLTAMKEWAVREKKDIKMATKPFQKEITGIPAENKKKIADLAYAEAKKIMLAMRAQGSASLLEKNI